MIPPFSAIITSPDVQKLSGGVNRVFLYSPQALVYKELTAQWSEKQRLPEKLKDRITQSIIEKIQETTERFPHIDYRWSGTDAELEIAVVHAWQEANIRTIEIVERQPKALVSNYIPVPSISTLLNSTQYQETVFQALITTAQKIRALAKTKNDPSLLHTDFHTRNFLYDGQPEAIALDPNVRKVRTTLPLDVLDTWLNVEFLHVLYHDNPPHRDQYLKQFATALNQDERNRILKYNSLSPVLVAGIITYETTSRWFGHKPKFLNRELLVHERRDRINDIVSSV